MPLLHLKWQIGQRPSGTKAEDKQKVEGAGLEDNEFSEEEDANLLVSARTGERRKKAQEVTRRVVEKENESFQCTPCAMFKGHMASERGVNPTGPVVGSAQPNGPLPLSS